MTGESWISQLHLNARSSVFVRDTQRRGGGHVTTEAESGVIWP